MDVKAWTVLLAVIIPAVTALWKSSLEEKRAGFRRPLHYHTKRHMLPADADEAQKAKRRHTSSQKPRNEMRKKPSGHLKPLDEDDMENDEVVSVAVGPPPVRPKYDKVNWKHTPKQTNQTNATATHLVKDVLVQLGREFLTHQVSEDFVFGQYVGNTMKNLTSDLRLKMQHDILELIVKYQRINRGEMKTEEKDISEKMWTSPMPSLKDLRTEKRATFNDTEETWPDFSNLAKIVG